MNAKLFFITGTDTGVGKTYFTAGVVNYLKKSGANVCAVKPIETGCNPECEDAVILSRSSGKSVQPIYSFKKALSPLTASVIERKPINIKTIKTKLARLKSTCEIMLIEGAGGIMVPIKEGYTFADMAFDLNADVIIVSLNKLGMINHTLLTVEVCKHKRLNIKAIVINNLTKKDESYETNYETLKKILTIPVFQFNDERDLEKLTKIFINQE